MESLQKTLLQAFTLAREFSGKLDVKGEVLITNWTTQLISNRAVTGEMVFRSSPKGRRATVAIDGLAYNGERNQARAYRNTVESADMTEPQASRAVARFIAYTAIGIVSGRKTSNESAMKARVLSGMLDATGWLIDSVSFVRSDETIAFEGDDLQVRLAVPLKASYLLAGEDVPKAVEALASQDVPASTPKEKVMLDLDAIA